MATYNKKLKRLEIYLMLDSTMIAVEDTASDPKASMVLAQFEKYQDLEWGETQQGFGYYTMYVPYHAIQYIEVTETDGEYEKADPYYCEDATEGGN